MEGERDRDRERQRENRETERQKERISEQKTQSRKLLGVKPVSLKSPKITMCCFIHT